MRKLIAFALVLSSALFLCAQVSPPQSALNARASVLGVERIKTGMDCYGYSTLGPSGPTKFQCKLLGVLYNNAGPGHHQIAALLGNEFQESGIIAGQSGSPVYTLIDGKEYFVGTVSFGEDSSKNPIASLTPAEDLLSASSYEAPTAPSPAPIQKTAKSQKPKPGDVVSIQYAFGWDFSLGIFGTVSYVDDQTGKIFLLGHSINDLGPCEYVIRPTTVIAVQKSDSSRILASTPNGAPILGIIEQDRAVGVMGTLGKEPKNFIPIVVKLSTSRGIDPEKLYFSTGDGFLGPKAGAACVNNAIESSSRAVGPKSVFLNGLISTSSGAILVNESFFGTAGVNRAISTFIQNRLGLILNNDFQKVKVDGVLLEIRVLEEMRLIHIEKIVLENKRTTVSPGDVVKLEVTVFQSHDPAKVSLIVPITVPKDASPGTVKISAGSASTIRALELITEKTKVTDVGTLVKTLSQQRNQNRIYVYVVYPVAASARDGIPATEEFEIKMSPVDDKSVDAGKNFIVVGNCELEFKIPRPSFWHRLFHRK